MHKKVFLITFLLILVNSVTIIQANQINFTDLPENHETRQAIDSLVSKNCVSGYGNNTFRPESNVQRVEAVKMLITCNQLPNLFNEKTIQVSKGSEIIIGNNTTTITDKGEIKIKIPFSSEDYSDLEFSDIEPDAWYIDSLKEGVIRGIVKGYNDGTIRPTKSVTKGELFTMIYRLAPERVQEIKVQEPLANDIATGYWFYNGLQMAIQNEIIQTNENNDINPSKELTRAEVAQHIFDYTSWLDLHTKPITQEERQEETEEISTNSTPNEIEEPIQEINNQIKTEGFEVGYIEKGIASFYGFSFDGRRTASGELLDTTSYMAAHKYLPFGSIVKITDPDTTKWIKVRIVDRGPFQDGRIIDLTPQAFQDLGFPLSKGITNVELEVISLPNT